MSRGQPQSFDQGARVFQKVHALGVGARPVEPELEPALETLACLERTKRDFLVNQVIQDIKRHTIYLQQDHDLFKSPHL